MRHIYLSLVLCILIHPVNSRAFNDDTTHPNLTERASSNSTLEGYLQEDLGISKGLKEKIGERSIIKWIRYGAEMEDAEDICRASNHFHNPNLFWGGSGLTGISLPVTALSYFKNYQHNERII